MIQYNKLKVLLSLQPTQEDNLSQRKPNPYQNFNILDQINTTVNGSRQDESFTILQLKAKLQKYIASPRRLTLEEIDRDFIGVSTVSLRKGICEEAERKKIKYRNSNLSCNLKETRKTTSNIGKRVNNLKKQKNKNRNKKSMQLSQIDKGKEYKIREKGREDKKRNENGEVKKTQPSKQMGEIKSTIAEFKQKIRQEKRQLIKELTRSNKSYDTLQRKRKGK